MYKIFASSNRCIVDASDMGRSSDKEGGVDISEKPDELDWAILCVGEGGGASFILRLWTLSFVRSFVSRQISSFSSVISAS